MEQVVWVGVDWADQEHAYSVKTEGEQYEGKFKSDPVAVHEWVRKLRERHPEKVIVIALEQSRGALMNALSGYEFLRLVPINPRAAKAYRQSLYLSGAKDDPLDADVIREFVANHFDRLRVWQPDDEPTRKLRLLVEGRRKFVEQRTSLTQALSAALKQYFPQILDWFGEANTTLTRAFIERWPTVAEAKAASPQAIRNLIRAHSRKKPAAIEDLVAKIATSVPLTTNTPVIEGLSILAQSLVTMLDAVEEPIQRYDREIAALWGVHEDHQIFDSFPGAGVVMAPRLAAAFGTDRTRFTTASEIQTYSGIAPVKEASGKRFTIRQRYHCPKFTRQTFHEFAEASLPFSDWALAYYRQQRERGAGHHTAIRSLAFRWMRILFRCWQNRTTYDEQVYIAALKRSSSPLPRRMAA